LCDGDRCDSKNYEVIGPDDSENKIWWLPWWLVQIAIPVVTGVNPKTRADYINKDKADACGCEDSFHLLALGLIGRV
jgi:hypothetical protein